jgi:hypothetical protein
MTPSREVRAIIAFVESTGLPHRVTDIDTPGVHVADSRHYAPGTDGRGLAVDLAGSVPGDTAAMFAIYRALLTQAGNLHELIYWGPGVDVLVRRRVKVVPSAYDPSVLAAHRNHVHVSVDLGTFLEPWEVPVPDDETLPNLTDLKFFVPVVDQAGKCTGYYMVSSTGEVHGWGPGAVYHGRSEVGPK